MIREKGGRPAVLDKTAEDDGGAATGEAASRGSAGPIASPIEQAVLTPTEVTKQLVPKVIEMDADGVALSTHETVACAIAVLLYNNER